MKANLLYFVFVLATLLAPGHFVGQQHGRLAGNEAKPLPQPQAQSAEIIPSIDLQFKSGDPIPGLTASPAIAMPVQCASDGSAVIQMLIPPDFQQTAFYRFDSSKSTPIVLSGIPKISRTVPIDIFASTSLVGVLLYAQESASDIYSPLTPGSFVALFEPSGAFKKLIKLPSQVSFLRFALLPSGDLVTLEFNPPTAVARLTLRDSSGEEERTLQIPHGLENVASPSAAAPVYSRSDNEKISGEHAVDRARFTAYGEKVLLWIPGNATVTEIGEGGSIRPVEVELPKGYALDGMIPSTNRWIVRFQRIGISDAGPADMRPEAQNFVLYEVHPGDGSLRRKLNLGRDGGWIACEKDGILTVFRTDEKQHLIPLTADLGR